MVNNNQRSGGTQVSDLITDTLKEMYDANRSKYRKSYKPKWARFKLKYKYLDGNESVHFSYDFLPVYSSIPGMKKTYQDVELEGFIKLTKSIEKMRVQDKIFGAMIFITFNPKKDTNVRDYDTAVACYQRGGKFQVVPQLKFDTDTGKARLELLRNLPENVFAREGGNK